MVRRERCHRSEDISISEQTAFVLRGGCLDKAVILEHIRVDKETGTKWFSLWRTDPILCSFLTNYHSGQRPLKNCPVLHTLKECRETERKRLQQEFVSAVGTSDEGQIEDKAASLGINAVVPSRFVGKPTTARNRVHNPVLLPLFFSLHITHGDGGTWRPRVLAGSPQDAVAMEATTENFLQLWRFVQSGPVSGQVPSPVAKRRRTVEDRPMPVQALPPQKYMQWDYDRNAFILEHKVATEFPAHARPMRKHLVKRKSFAVPVSKDLEVDASHLLTTFEFAQSQLLPFRERGHDSVAHEASACIAHEASEVVAHGALAPLDDEDDIVLTMPALRDSFSQFENN